MARSIAIPTILTRARRRLDIESASGRFPDSELLDEANESAAELWDLLIRTRGHSFFEKTGTITTAASTSTYSLPTDCLILLSAEITYGGHPIRLKEFNREERPLLADGNAGWSGEPFRYRIRGKTTAIGTTNDIIELLPTPAGVYTVTLYYIPNAPKATPTYTTLSTNFTVPSASNGTVTITGDDLSWCTLNGWVYIKDAGYFKTTTLTSSTQVVITNTGVSGNVAAATVISGATATVTGALITYAGATSSAPSTPTVTSSTWDGLDGWEEYIVVDVARKIALKEDQSTMVGILNGEKDRLRERIQALAANRAAGDPPRVIDIKSRPMRRRFR